ncbi:MAG: hypothetical protein EXS15_03390 [Phycisphaerales bacterium]|nr:hypothetical protein [Phycisphaerales bacterium]
MPSIPVGFGPVYSDGGAGGAGGGGGGAGAAGADGGGAGRGGGGGIVKGLRPEKRSVDVFANSECRSSARAIDEFVSLSGKGVNRSRAIGNSSDAKTAVQIDTATKLTRSGRGHFFSLCAPTCDGVMNHLLCGDHVKRSPTPRHRVEYQPFSCPRAKST